MYPARTGLIVWTQHLKAVKVLERYGNVHYVSRKMKYVVLYVNQDQVAQTVKQLEQLNFVKAVEYSYRNKIKTEYSSQSEDKTRFYSL